MNKNTSEISLQLSKNKFVRVLFIILGFTCVALGVIGIFLPVMPTTIFLILASYFFARSSEKFSQWLLNNKVFGSYLRNYKNGKGMTLKSKIFSISFLWVGILISVIFLVQNIYVNLLLFAIAIGVTIHILYIKTFQPENN
ncbi:MAG: YbaN family protein [Bacteroidota bacterium]|nr:YbaN family protein [Bacteroidota bacterium]